MAIVQGGSQLGPLALARPEDEADRRHVRHACGYGCVRCGATIWQYRTMSGRTDVEDIVLLCPPCAHALIGREGAERALRVMRGNPVARQPLFDRRKLPYGDDLPDLTIIPGVTMRRTLVPIMFGRMPVLRLDAPEVAGGAVGISVALGRAGEEPGPVILSNEWLAGEGEWTFERPGNRYVITSRDRTAQMILVIVTPQLLALELLRTHGNGQMLESGLQGTRVDGVARFTPTAKGQIIGMVV